MPIRILYGITKSTWGGAQDHLFNLVKYQQKKGNHVAVFVGTEGELTDRLTTIGVDFFVVKALKNSLNPLSTILAVFDVSKLIKTFNPDIVHVHSSMAGTVGRIAARINKIPSIFTAHGWAFTDGITKSKKFIFLAIEKLMFAISTKVICVSNYDRKLAQSKGMGNRKPEKMVTIQNGIRDDERLAKGKHSGIHIVMVARFDKPKNQLALINAINKLPRNQIRSVDVSFVGDGPTLETCKKVAKKGNINVHFLGFKKNVGSVLDNADVFALISDYEGLPISIIEAMQHALPIIASDVGGVGELVTDGINGRLIKNNSPEEIAKVISEEFKDNRLEVMGRKSRIIYLNEFTDEIMFDKIDVVYSQVLSGAAK